MNLLLLLFHVVALASAAEGRQCSAFLQPRGRSPLHFAVGGSGGGEGRNKKVPVMQSTRRMTPLSLGFRSLLSLSLYFSVPPPLLVASGNKRVDFLRVISTFTQKRARREMEQRENKERTKRAALAQALRRLSQCLLARRPLTARLRRPGKLAVHRARAAGVCQGHEPHRPHHQGAGVSHVNESIAVTALSRQKAEPCGRAGF